MASQATIALITAANGGLGNAITTILAERHGYHVIIGSRNGTNGVSVANALKDRGLSASAVQLDLTSDASIYDALQTNVVGTAILTDLCLPLFERAEVPRIVFVSSRDGSMQHNLDRAFALYGVPMPAYKASKAGASALAISYMTKLEPRRGMVNIGYPGFVYSKMAVFNPQGRPP
ncbi:hypothetical protein F5X96DRAFT_667752 [Biscogniauxia mediterranea]|nr:hypothetical protein F5X96DRAFT_667752 [Biscogniauxia mediterranea]